MNLVRILAGSSEWAAMRLCLFLIACADPTFVSGDMQTFYVDDPRNRNVVTFESRATLERVVGSTHAVTGHFRLDLLDVTSCSGLLRVSLDSLDTGIALRDTQMRDHYLETKSFPEAVLRIEGVIGSPVPVVVGEPFHAKLIGSFSLHGVTLPEEVSIDGVYFLESAETRAKMQGNLLQIRATFDLRLGDYAIPVPKLVALQLDEVVRIRVDLTATDARPVPASEGP
jgi:polyisoprenoid-binding protein YceI